MFFKKRKSSMEKEIFEQSKILEHLVNTYINDKDEILIDIPEGIEQVIFVASGSSYHCARYGADVFGSIANLEARAIYSSEFLKGASVVWMSAVPKRCSIFPTPWPLRCLKARSAPGKCWTN